MLHELLELLSGKKVPGRVNTFSGTRSAVAEQLLGQYAAVLAFLKQHGALMNAVKPEALMDADSLRALLRVREARATTPEQVTALQQWCVFRFQRAGELCKL